MPAAHEESARPARKILRASNVHAVLRLLVIAVFLHALGSAIFEAVTFTEQIVRLARGAQR